MSPTILRTSFRMHVIGRLTINRLACCCFKTVFPSAGCSLPFPRKQRGRSSAIEPGLRQRLFFPFPESAMSFLTLEVLLLRLGLLPPLRRRTGIFVLREGFLFLAGITSHRLDSGPRGSDVWTRWRSSSNGTDINLNPSARFKGDLLRSKGKLNKHGLRMASYSPVTILMADCLTEAAMEPSFPGQPKYPHQSPSEAEGIIRQAL